MVELAEQVLEALAPRGICTTPRCARREVLLAEAERAYGFIYCPECKVPLICGPNQAAVMLLRTMQELERAQNGGSA